MPEIEIQPADAMPEDIVRFPDGSECTIDKDGDCLLGERFLVRGDIAALFPRGCFTIHREVKREFVEFELQCRSWLSDGRGLWRLSERDGHFYKQSNLITDSTYRAFLAAYEAAKAAQEAQK